MATFTEVLAREQVAPIGALAEIEVPVLCGPQRQGDVLIVPAAPSDGGVQVGASGVPVVRGEATGNAHVLHADGDVTWEPAVEVDGSVVLGHLTVADGSVGWLIHTEEHGVNGVGPGSYMLHGKREQADLIRRVAD